MRVVVLRRACQSFLGNPDKVLQRSHSMIYRNEGARIGRYAAWSEHRQQHIRKSRSSVVVIPRKVAGVGVIFRIAVCTWIILIGRMALLCIFVAFVFDIDRSAW